ncbi:MAG: hypothetical protein GY862_15045 [Gammaproteobacteria bacterium]|nr:hypothetical protein [Gammaproteobacteria bacterium]
MATTELDSLWKEILEQYFEEFIHFFFPEIHALIDWKPGYEFLDKEFQQMVHDAELGQRLADKLVKVWLFSGEPAQLHTHVEVQDQFDSEFPERMFVCHYRIFDRYKQRIISLAVLGNKNKEWHPSRYSHAFGGCRLKFDFPVVKLMDYLARWDELEQDPSLFSIVVRTHLKEIQTRKQPTERLRWKIRFKDIPEQLVKKIRSITDIAFLSELHRKAVLVKSVPVFERIIKKHDKAAKDRQAA